MTPHKHAEVIRAYADGHQIQVMRPQWSKWSDIDQPMFHKDCEYRVKPEPKRYRVWETKAGIMYVTQAHHHDKTLPTKKYFGRWISDWVEYA